jgi:DNA replication and repair protein RecF
MWIETLSVNNCRLLTDVSLDLSPYFNIIIGENASGKTSLLESLNILSSGRSFRTSHILDVITHQKDSVLVSAKINDDGTYSQVGIEKSHKKTKIRINKVDVFSQAELSLHCPITVIHPDSIHLITGSPTVRRSYIDWLAFYLFPVFYGKWKKYKHILKQRNLCLKSKKHRYALQSWTNELVALQPEINNYRLKAVKTLTPILKKISNELLGDIKVDLIFKSGFPADLDLNKKSLLTYYANKEDYDLKLQRTTAVVHRADIIIQLNGKPAHESASRGQLKLLAITLLLAQSNAINTSRSVKGILLIDDLAAELDKKNKKQLLKFISELAQQIIITSTKAIEMKTLKGKMFHVKHGDIEEVHPPTF